MNAKIKIISKNKQNNNLKTQLIKNSCKICSCFNENSFIIKFKKENLILKIRQKRKFQFIKIELLSINNKTWFGKSINSEDLIFIKQLNDTNFFEICILHEQWKYRLLILSLIQLNQNVDSIYNKLNKYP